MALRDELLKAIWHAFTSLDVDQSGKVSKSQLKVNTVSGLSVCVREKQITLFLVLRLPSRCVSIKTP